MGSAIEAMRAGAYDYVTKPFRAGEILQAVEKALERVRLRREVAQLRQAGAKDQKRFVERGAHGSTFIPTDDISHGDFPTTDGNRPAGFEAREILPLLAVEKHDRLPFSQRAFAVFGIHGCARRVI